MQQSDRTQTESLSGEDGYTVGAILRGARKASGEDIEDISRTLRINRRYLEALEDGRFKDLPGDAYAIGFIRSYADYLNLDGEEMIARYKEASKSGGRTTKLDFPEPLPETGLPGGVVLFAGIVVAVLAYGGWYLASEHDTSIASLVAPVPENLANDYNETEEAAAQSVAEITETQATVPENDVGVTEPADAEVIAEEAGADTASEPESPVVVATGAEQDAPESTEQQPIEEESTAQADTTGADAVMEDTIGTETGTEEEAATEAAGGSVANTTEESEQAGAEDTMTEDAGAEEQAEESGQIAGAVENGSDDAQSLNEQQLLAVQASLEQTSLGQDSPENATAVEPDTDTTSTSTLTPTSTGDPDGEDTSRDAVDDTVEDTSREAGDDTTDGAVDDTGGPSSQVASAETTADGVEQERTPRVYGETGDVRIVITATADSWAEVRDTVLDELLLTRLLRPGDSFRVPDRSDLVLATGNAGGLEIIVDGAVVPPVGGDGHIRRDVPLDPDLLVAGEAAN